MEPQQNTSERDGYERIPCKDESCIGTIGTDGRCRECGLPMDSQSAALPFAAEDDVSENDSAETSEESEEIVWDDEFPDEEDPDEEVEDSVPGDWEERTVCRDESCTGTIGPDGRCRVCGLAYGDSK